MGFIVLEERVVKAFFENYPAEQPVMMLNQLKFRSRASYPTEVDAESCTGLEAFVRFSTRVIPLIEAVGGEQVWQGRPHAMLIGPDDEDWDLVVMIRFPSAQAVLTMVTSEEYQAALVHRAAAVENSRLIALEEL